jgi:hypothetical protein
MFSVPPVRELKVSSTWELQLEGASQRGQEAVDMAAKDAKPLETATKQRSEDRD